LEIKFTGWGGVIGPKMFHHVQCMQCSKTYNAKTGKSNDTAIAIYIAVSSVLVFVLFYFMFSTGVFKF